MTKHQAPEVTSADIALAEEIVSAANIVSHDGYYEADIYRAAATIAAHRTRATQPQSLTIDEGLASSVRSLHALTTDDVARNGPLSSTMVRAGLLLDILDRLQSLSLPVAGEQIAENANCSAEATSLQKTQTTAERVREACAKVAENACYNPPTDREMEVWNEAGEHIAAAIRSLPIGDA